MTGAKELVDTSRHHLLLWAVLLVAAGHAEPGVVELGLSSSLSWQLAWKPSYVDHLLPLSTHCRKKLRGEGEKSKLPFLCGSSLPHRSPEILFFPGESQAERGHWRRGVKYCSARLDHWCEIPHKCACFCNISAANALILVMYDFTFVSLRCYLEVAALQISLWAQQKHRQRSFTPLQGWRQKQQGLWHKTRESLCPFRGCLPLGRGVPAPLPASLHESQLSGAMSYPLLTLTILFLSMASDRDGREMASSSISSIPSRFSIVHCWANTSPWERQEVSEKRDGMEKQNGCFLLKQ